MSLKSLSIVAAAAMALCSFAAQAAEQMANGGFETVDPNNASLAFGWLSNQGGYTRQSAEVYAGSWAMQIQALRTSSASGAEQNNMKDGGVLTPLAVGGTPLLSFFAKGTSGTTGDLKVRMAYLDGIGNIKWDSGFQNFAPGALSQTTWNQFSVQGPAVGLPDLAVFVQFNLGIGPVDPPNLTAGNVYIDNLSVQAIPEPGTYALMLAGLAGVGLFAKRRRRAA